MKQLVRNLTSRERWEVHLDDICTKVGKPIHAELQKKHLGPMNFSVGVERGVLEPYPQVKRTIPEMATAGLVKK